MLGGVALLLCELRFEHREVLGETWRSWIPLIYAAVTLLGGLVALLRWDGKSTVIMTAFAIPSWYVAARFGTASMV